MANTFYLRAAAFGGYDKSDVDKRLEALYAKVNELKNDLRETKQLLKKYEEGKGAEEAYEATLAVERATITQLQVKNDMLTEKYKSASEVARMKEQENVELRKKTEELEAELASTKTELATLSASDSAMALSAVFIEAQKSRELLLTSAKTEAQTIEQQAKEFAEQYITDVNNQAAKAVYEAERRAAEIKAEAKNAHEAAKVTEENLRAVMLDDIDQIGAIIVQLHRSFQELGSAGMRRIKESEHILKQAKDAVTAGGVPVFHAPETAAPEYPAEPDYAQAPPTASEKQQSELDRLMSMAEALEPEKKSGKSVGLDDLMQQAAALSGDAKDAPAKKTPAKEAPAKEAPKSGGISLADLAKQAEALES